MWNIVNHKMFKMAINTKVDLKLKIFEKEDCNAVHVSYKGYNIVFAMEVWGFCIECKNWQINERMEGDPVKNI